ncbi:MAG TPA: VOC family protein [Longimicrobiales bacterium]|nr:VOC family protein [Longimicrobiales bacterium]
MHREQNDRESAGSTDPEYGIAPPGYRLPAQTRPGQVRLQVSDLEQSLAYYTRVLGLHVVSHAGGRAVLSAQGELRPLIELYEHPGAAPVPARGQLGLYHYAILLPDRAALGRVLRHLLDLGIHPGASDHLVSEALYLHDPDGLGIELYADRARSTWRHAARELTMSTEPLDSRSVLAAAGGSAWSGMPAGTVMGHVHLHVRSIADATSFYHETLGFDRVVWSYPGALFMSAGGYHHHLGVNIWAGADARPAPPDAARLLEWQIVVPTAADVAAAAASLEAAGHALQRDGSTIVVTDAAGTSVRIRAEE